MSDGLNSGVVVLLVDLLVESSCYALMLVRTNMFLSDRRPDVLVYGSLVLPIVGEEAGDGLLCFLHFDSVD